MNDSKFIISRDNKESDSKDNNYDPNEELKKEEEREAENKRQVELAREEENDFLSEQRKPDWDYDTYGHGA